MDGCSFYSTLWCPPEVLPMTATKRRSGQSRFSCRYLATIRLQPPAWVPCSVGVETQ